MEPTTATLEAFRRGEREAFACMVQGFGSTVRSIVMRYFREPFDRDEALQEVWLHLYRQRQALDPDRAGEVRGFVATLARRRCIELLRAAGRQPPVDEGDEAAAPDPAGEAERAAAGERRELAEAVAAFRARLDPEWQRFFDLHFVEGLPAAEVARRLGMGVPRSKYVKRVLVARARRHRALMAALGRLRDPEGDDAP